MTDFVLPKPYDIRAECVWRVRRSQSWADREGVQQSAGSDGMACVLTGAQTPLPANESYFSSNKRLSSGEYITDNGKPDLKFLL